MSATTASKSPGAGRCSGGASNGSSSGRPSRRKRQGKGISSSAPPSSPAATPQPGAAAAVHRPKGRPASSSSTRTKACTSRLATAHSGGATMPASVSGTIASVTSGMASRLAAKPTSDTCWKNTRLSGARPMLATAWVCRPRRSAWRRPRPAGAGSATISSATAAKDSQKPGCSNAQGSNSVTITAAASSTSSAGQRSAALRSSATVASIHSVRCAGTPQPASSA